MKTKKKKPRKMNYCQQALECHRPGDLYQPDQCYVTCLWVSHEFKHSDTIFLFESSFHINKAMLAQMMIQNKKTAFLETVTGPNCAVQTAPYVESQSPLKALTSSAGKSPQRGWKQGKRTAHWELSYKAWSSVRFDRILINGKT
jgi:hypothetical protein